MKLDPGDMIPTLEVVVWKDGKRVYHDKSVFDMRVDEGGELQIFPTGRPTEEKYVFGTDEYDDVEISVA